MASRRVARRRGEQGGRKMILGGGGGGGGGPFKLKTYPFLPSHLRLQFQGLNNEVTNYR